MTSQRVNSKYKWPPYSTDRNRPHENFLRTPLFMWLLLIFHCYFTGVTWGYCPWITVCQSLLSWQRVDNQFSLVDASRCYCCFRPIYWLFLKADFIYKNSLFRQNLPVTLLRSWFYFLKIQPSGETLVQTCADTLQRSWNKIYRLTESQNLGQYLRWWQDKIVK